MLRAPAVPCHAVLYLIQVKEALLDAELSAGELKSGRDRAAGDLGRMMEHVRAVEKEAAEHRSAWHSTAACGGDGMVRDCGWLVRAG